MGHLSFALSLTGTYRLRFLAGKDEGGRVYWLLDAICQCTCTDDASTAITWAALRNKLLKYFYQKRTETSLHKKISKKISSPCRDGSMHECTGWQKLEVPCTQWYALHNIATLFNNHLYISSSGTPVGSKFFHDQMVHKSDNDQVTVVGAGVTLQEAIIAYDALKAEGINIRVVDPFTLKPIDNMRTPQTSSTVRQPIGHFWITQVHWQDVGQL